MMDTALVNTAMGRAPADLVIRGGTLINVFSGEMYQADVAVLGSRIAAVGTLPGGAIGSSTRVIDGAGKFIVPGFIDAHIHVESSMLSYTEFCKLAVKHGTTAVATDLMEVTIVSGVDGMKEILREAENLPVKLFYPVPSFMEEETGLQTIGSTLRTEYIEELLKLPQAVGIAETLVPPILAGSPASARVIAAAEALRKTVEGHAPGLTGDALNAYAGAGVTSDHESTTREEALAKLRSGLRVLMREGSASTDLAECLRIITEDRVSSRRCSMVSDDVDALHLARLGHMDHKVRMAIGMGVPPVEAIQMVTINPAENLRIDGRCGSVAPGKDADIVLLSNLKDCRVDTVIARGEIVVEQGLLVKAFPKPDYNPLLLDTVKLFRPVRAEDMVIRAADPAKKQARVHVIGASGATLFTRAETAVLPVLDAVIQADAGADLLRIACVERYGKNGNIGRSFIRGFGFKDGAIAISVGHDHHNITVVGIDPSDMALAVNRVAALEGGFVLVQNHIAAAEIALPVCGLLSTEGGEKVADTLEAMGNMLGAAGCTIPSPNVTLSFIPLIFIPELAITDYGLFDVRQFRIIDPVIEFL
ncbi:MAG: amidohydrolase family protein [Treponema sp.]|jgi:adenine deaminase|nr:amidohydrolase family protein [Treponema sp.]